MFRLIRGKYGSLAVGIVIGAIAFVFIFFGVYSPRWGNMGPGGYAALVNGEPVTLKEFYQTYEQRIKFFESMMKGQADRRMIESLGLKQVVLDDLVRQKLMLQEAKNLGLMVGDAEVAAKIRELPYFQKEGKFDREVYEKTLQANQLKPGKFEDTIREDLLTQKVSGFLKQRLRVSDKEIEDDFYTNGNQRQVDYVFLSIDDARKKIQIPDSEVHSFVADAKNQTELKQYYDAHALRYAAAPATKAKKDSAQSPKPRPFEEVKDTVARDVLREKHTAEARKANEELAKRIESMVQQNSGEASVKSFAKAQGLDVKTSEKFSSGQGMIPGLGNLPELKDDAFKADSALAKGPKLYHYQDHLVVAWNLKTHVAKPEDFAKQKETIAATVTTRKEREFFDGFMSDLQKRAKIKYNDELLKAQAPEDEERNAPPSDAGAHRAEEL